MLRDQNKQEHLPRVKSSEKVHSITTISPGAIQKVKNGTNITLSKARYIQLANEAMQEAAEKLEGKSIVEIVEITTKFGMLYDECRKIALQKNIKQFHDNLDKSQTEHIAKQKTKIRKRNEVEAKSKPSLKGLSKEERQRASFISKLEITNPQDLAEANEMFERMFAKKK